MAIGNEPGMIGVALASPPPNRASDSLASVAVVSFTRALSQILTLVLGVLSAAQYGASMEKDCYVLAQTLPTLLGTILTGGIYSLLIAALTEIAPRQGIAGQRAFLIKALGQLSIVLLPLGVAALAFPAPLVGFIAPGFGPSQIHLSSRLLPLAMFGMIGSVYFMFVRALFNVRHQFAAPGFVNLVPGVVSIGTLILAAPSLGIFALALGPVIGFGLATFILSTLAFRLLRDPGGTVPSSRSVSAAASPKSNFWRDFLPMSIGANFGQVNLLVDNAFISFLPPGTITQLGFASVVVTNASALTIYSLAEVALPRFAAAILEGRERLSHVVRTDLRYMLVLTAPISFGCLAFGRPLTRLLFERGQFGPESTEAVARILAWLAPGILFLGYQAIFWRALVAQRRLRALLWISLAGMGLNGLLDFVLVRWMGVEGIALSTSLVTTLLSALFAVATVRGGVAVAARGDALFAARVLLSAAVMGAAVYGLTILFERTCDVSREQTRLVEVGGGLLIGAGIYALFLRLLGVAIVAEVARRASHLAAAWKKP